MLAGEYPDTPKSLGNENIGQARIGMLHASHIDPLTRFVERIREEKHLDREVPYFDPLDGGVNAKTLFVLEAPGPKAVASGFISRNNPDESAKNMFSLLEEAGFQRNETLIWNIVPWYIGTGRKIRPANSNDIKEGLFWLKLLINMLPELEAVVLVGKKACKVRQSLVTMTRQPIFETSHPSPLFVNNKPGNRSLIFEAFCDVKKYINSSSGIP